MLTATIYAHVSKESNAETGASLGLTGEAMAFFLHACGEVELGVEVDEKSGAATVVSVDGKRLERDAPNPETTDQTQSPGAALIAEERARQISGEGYDAAHDDAHTDGSIGWAAAWYAAPDKALRMGMSCDPGDLLHVRFDACWPWERDGNRKVLHSRIRQLAIAGALCAAEIDRLMRIKR